MESRKNTATVRICNSEYNITSDDSEEYILRVGHFVDKRMTEICANDSRLSTALGAVLTAVNIADDFLRLSSELEDARAVIRGQTQDLANMDELKTENKRLETELRNLELELAKLDAVGKNRKTVPYPKRSVKEV